jgi:hypothetical protein
MGEFFSLAWWLTAVLSGVVSSLGAAYSKPWLDKSFVRISTSWKQYKQQQDVILQRTVDRLRSSPHMQTIAEIREVREELRSFFWYFMTIVTLFSAMLAYFGYQMACHLASVLERPPETNPSALPVLLFLPVVIVSFCLANWYRGRARDIEKTLNVLANDEREPKGNENGRT